MAGDRRVATKTQRGCVWQVIGQTLKRRAPAQLVTFHTFGRTQSSTWFQDTPWLDFNLFTSGHRRYDQDIDGKRYGEDNWRYVLDDLAQTPRKPTLDGEPAYENTPQGLHDPSQPYWTAADARRSAWWSVLPGRRATRSAKTQSGRSTFPWIQSRPAVRKGTFSSDLTPKGRGRCSTSNTSFWRAPSTAA